MTRRCCRAWPVLLRAGQADVAVGSRYVGRRWLGHVGCGSRARMSSFATRLARLLRVDVADPMSGFFMVRRPVFERASRRLSALGFKILLDLLASQPGPVRVVELPYRFATRQAGESKLDAGVLRDFALLLADKLVGRWVPVRFLMFAAVGLLGNRECT